MWANRKNPRTPCIIVLTEDGISPQTPRWRMYNSTCARWIPSGVSGVPGQIGDRRQLGARHRVRLERQQNGIRHGISPAI